MLDKHQSYMGQALKLAHKAALEGEVPVGALLVIDDQIIAQTYNQSIYKHDPCAHAEILALRAAANQLKNYRLPKSTLYVTLEPCSMCAGALVHARIENLFFGAYDLKAGAVTSQYQLLDTNLFQHRVKWQGGILQEGCSEIISAFFKKRRLEKKLNIKNSQAK
ncbi:MAG: tRNA adenosine(34) deaminase TadA [Gammaproteobacteria bacterium CG22_combo_CG10-13_8_21_14_all_40_8]|nr:MAG: tRNA adenosine(34) deaminase TadA [Gammaproteobacteria bacterium CG22_combo_CG10-13_8_21_14_all_40_8]